MGRYTWREPESTFQIFGSNMVLSKNQFEIPAPNWHTSSRSQLPFVSTLPVADCLCLSGSTFREPHDLYQRTPIWKTLTKGDDIDEIGQYEATMTESNLGCWFWLPVGLLPHPYFFHQDDLDSLHGHPRKACLPSFTYIFLIPTKMLRFCFWWSNKSLGSLFVVSFLYRRVLVSGGLVLFLVPQKLRHRIFCRTASGSPLLGLVFPATQKSPGTLFAVHLPYLLYLPRWWRYCCLEPPGRFETLHPNFSKNFKWTISSNRFGGRRGDPDQTYWIGRSQSFHLVDKRGQGHQCNWLRQSTTLCVLKWLFNCHYDVTDGGTRDPPCWQTQQSSSRVAREEEETIFNACLLQPCFGIPL